MIPKNIEKQKHAKRHADEKYRNVGVSV